MARKRAVLTALIERIEVSVDQIDIRSRPTQLDALLDDCCTIAGRDRRRNRDPVGAGTASPRRAGDQDGDRRHRSVCIAKPDARLIRLLIRAHRFHTTLAEGEGIPFAALAKREGVSRSYFTRLVRLSYLAPDITQTILDGRQPPDLTPDKLLAHSRLPLAWHDQRPARLCLSEKFKSTAMAADGQLRRDPRGIAPIPSAALRYWNMARQRYCRWIARFRTILRVSADPVAKPAAHTRAESRGFRPSKAGCGRETDCLLEGDGFELPVPQGRPGKQRRQPSTQFLCGDRASKFARLAAGGTRFEPLGPRCERRVPCPLISRHEWILSAVRATFSIAGNQRETWVTSP